jgi:hypothetical protein
MGVRLAKKGYIHNPSLRASLERQGMQLPAYLSPGPDTHASPMTAMKFIELVCLDARALVASSDENDNKQACAREARAI